jgi:hypothetical protein
MSNSGQALCSLALIIHLPIDQLIPEFLELNPQELLELLTEVERALGDETC